MLRYLSVWLSPSCRRHACTHGYNADGLPRQQLGSQAAQGCTAARVGHAAPRLSLAQPRAPGQPAHTLLKHRSNSREALLGRTFRTPSTTCFICFTCSAAALSRAASWLPLACFGSAAAVASCAHAQPGRTKENCQACRSASVHHQTCQGGGGSSAQGHGEAPRAGHPVSAAAAAAASDRPAVARAACSYVENHPCKLMPMGWACK